MGNILDGIWNLAAIISQFFPGTPTFSTDQIPDLTGQVMIVTGGNSGIGKETVKVLLEHNAKVYMACRNRGKAIDAISELKDLTGKEAIFLELDLSRLASIRNAAEEFSSKEQHLHVLFNNAGVMWCPAEWLTADGYDMQFGTNVLGHFFLTQLLIPMLTETARSASADHHARVVTTSSSAAYCNSLEWESFRDGPKRRKMSTDRLYSQSKFSNVVVSLELARRYGDRGIISLSLNPGAIDTELKRYAPRWKQIFLTAVQRPVSMGALTQLWAGTMPEVLNHNGKFLIPWARVGQCRKEAYDSKIGEKLWTWLAEQCDNA